MMSGTTDLVFISAYHKLSGVSEAEWIGYYAPGEMDRLRTELTSYVDHQLDLFSVNSDYEEYFALVEYDHSADMIRDFEEAAFRSALSPADRNANINDLDSLAILCGFRGVIRNRLGSGNMAEIRSAVELFNGIIEGAIECVDDGNPRSRIRVETAAEFGPVFVDGLLKSIEVSQKPWRYDPYSEFIGETFAPLKPLLDILNRLVHCDGWPRTDLAVGELLLVVCYFKQVVEEEWQP
jgi:hypothetical protein